MDQEEGEEGGCAPALPLPGHRKPQVNSSTPFKQRKETNNTATVPQSIILSLWKVGEGSDSRLSLTTRGALGQPGLYKMVTKQQLQREKKKHNHLHSNKDDDHTAASCLLRAGHTLRLLVHCAERRSSSFQ